MIGFTSYLASATAKHISTKTGANRQLFKRSLRLLTPSNFYLRNDSHSFLNSICSSRSFTKVTDGGRKHPKPSLLQGARVVLRNADLSITEDEIMDKISSHKPKSATRCFDRNGTPKDRMYVWFNSWPEAQSFVEKTSEEPINIKGFEMKSAHSSITHQYERTKEEERAERLVKRYRRALLAEDGGIVVEGVERDYSEQDKNLFYWDDKDLEDKDEIGFRKPRIRYPVNVPPLESAPRITKSQLYKDTARNPSEVASDYDVVPDGSGGGIVEAFDRLVAGDSYENIMKSMKLDIDPAAEERFKVWEELVATASSHFRYIPDDLATDWNVPPLTPQPPNLIQKQKREKIEKARIEILKKKGAYKKEAQEDNEHIQAAPVLYKRGKEVQYTIGDWVENVVMQDRTQKITKSGQITTYRTLVTVGNANGTGGFGMGRGASPDLSLKRAFREARKNLMYVDRYKMYGLNYPLYGEHNSLRVYIYPMKRGKGLRAGRVVEGILEGFGIADATAKSIGRRHPYSVVRATFNALNGHESLHEIALRRGRRLLSIHKTLMGRSFRDDPKYY